MNMRNEDVGKNKSNEDELNNYEQWIQQEAFHLLLLKEHFPLVKSRFRKDVQTSRANHC